MTAIAIDPAGCGCTECLTGEYVPFDLASDEQIADMIYGKIANHTYVTNQEIFAWLASDRSRTGERFRKEFFA